MGEYFKLWRRKVGVVTLLLACLFMVGWVRGLSIVDHVCLESSAKSKQMVSLMSASHGIALRKYEAIQSWGWFSFSSGWGTIPVTSTNGDPFGLITSLNEPRRGWRSQYFGFDFGVLNDDNFRNSFLIIPYWFIVIPLTAISAYLLLSKSRKSTQTKTTQPIQNEGGVAL